MPRPADTILHSCREEEAVQHSIVGCSSYKRPRGDLTAGVVTVIGGKEWTRKLGEDHGAIFRVLVLHGGNKETERRIVRLPKVFLIQC